MVSTRRSRGLSERLPLSTPKRTSQSVSQTPASTKRGRGVVEIEEDDREQGPAAKRRQLQTPQLSKDGHLWMFDGLRGDLDDTNYPKSAPAKALHASVRRRRRPGPIPRQDITNGRSLIALHGDNPFGKPSYKVSETTDRPWSEESLGTEDRDASSTHERDQRSAAPEPETPRRGLFGSLRNFGSATIGFARHAVSNLAPRSTSSPVNGQPGAHRPKTLVLTDVGSSSGGDSFYPKLPTPEKRERQQGGHVKQPNANESTDSWRRARDDHHGDQFSPQRDPDVVPATISVDDDEREFWQKKRARKEKLLAASETGDDEMSAPLFGNDSHFARGTVNPDHDYIKKGGSVFTNMKRKFEIYENEGPTTESDATAETSRNKRFNPYVEDEVEQDDENDENVDDTVTTPVAKRQKPNPPPPRTPRSALKKPGSFNASVFRSSKSVLFHEDPVSGVRDLRGYYGPAGQYTGSTFADALSPSSASESGISSVGKGAKIHPSEHLGKIVFENTPFADSSANISFQWRDPHDPEWRPSLANPRPGHFRVPDLDEEMNEGTDTESEATPEQPQTPRMSHAELPKSPQNIPAATPSLNENGAPNGGLNGTSGGNPTSAALEKARSDAQKFKPKSQSRLSEVTAARSRSSSPPADRVGDTLSSQQSIPATAGSPTASDVSVATPPELGEEAKSRSLGDFNGRRPSGLEERCIGGDDPDDVQYAQQGVDSLDTLDWLPESVRKQVPKGAHVVRCLDDSILIYPTNGGVIYDDTFYGHDGMTTLARQHQSDGWATSLRWDASQTYEDAGVGSQFVVDLVRKHWTEEDDKRTQLFWDTEWKVHEAAIEDAQARGLELELVVDGDDTEL